MNLYDQCIMNKIVNGKQCTIIWHMDDVKGSHVEQKVLDKIADQLGEKYGQETPLTPAHCGKVHDYLGSYDHWLLRGWQSEVQHAWLHQRAVRWGSRRHMAGTTVTPAENDLFTMHEDAKQLNNEQAKMFHHLMAKILYLSKRAHPKVLPTVLFLMTWVTKSNVDDWKKLGRCIKYLWDSKHLVLMLEVEEGLTIKWYMDASLAVHPDIWSHTGATMTLSKWAVYSILTKQVINAKSLMEVELLESMMQCL